MLPAKVLPEIALQFGMLKMHLEHVLGNVCAKGTLLTTYLQNGGR